MLNRQDTTLGLVGSILTAFHTTKSCCQVHEAAFVLLCGIDLDRTDSKVAAAIRDELVCMLHPEGVDERAEWAALAGLDLYVAQLREELCVD